MASRPIRPAPTISRSTLSNLVPGHFGHPDELFPISEDYKAQYTVSFRLPKALRTDPTFRERLNLLVPISPELDDDDFQGYPDEADD
jgi:hypothetical protein